MGDAEDGGGDQFPRAASPASLFAAVWSGFRLLFFWRFLISFRMKIDKRL